MSRNPWTSEIALTAPHRMGGCAIGDVDPDRVGNEIVATCATGDLLRASREGGAWKQATIAHFEGELILCSTGHFLPGVKGEQIVAAGMVKGEEDEQGPGQVVIVWKEGGTWRSERVLATDRLAHTAIVTGIDGAPAIAAGDYTGRLVLIRRGDKGDWTSEVIFQGTSPIKHIIEGYFDRGVEIAVADTGGAVTLVRRTGDGWAHERIYQSPKSLNRLGLRRRMGSDTRNSDLIVSGNGGELVSLDHRGGAWNAEVLYRGNVKLRGAVDTGGGIATADYAGDIILVRQPKPEVLFHDTGAIHHVVVGVIDGIPSLVACGHAGRTILLQRRRQ